MNKRYCNGMVHVIKQGETLYQLSRRYRVPLALILRANPYVDVYNLQVGQEICIPMVRQQGGMICMPIPGMNPRNMGMQENSQMQGRMEGAAGQDVQEEMREDMENMVQMESEAESQTDHPEKMRQDKEAGCQMCAGEKVEKNDVGNREKDDDDVEIYITTGDRSLGDILNEYGVNWEDFIKNNDLGQIALGEDVILYLPKKVLK